VKVLRSKGELCTQCYACEQVCSTNFTKVEDREKSAIRIGTRLPDSGAVEIITCNQCGECIDICPTNAIYRAKNGNVLINKNLCVGCFSCVGFCPHAAMFRHRDMLEPFKCIACAKCVKECPAGALYMEEVSGSQEEKMC